MSLVPLAALLLILTVLPLAAQDQFGRAVALGHDEIFVLKPSAGRGPAAVYVYRVQRDGTWQVSERLRPAGGEETGEGFSRSLALADDVLLVGSGDPNMQWAAQAFARGVAGEWAATEKLPLASDLAGAQEAKLDFAAILRILQPPARTVAVQGDRAVVAAPSGPVRSRGVWVFERRDDSVQWSAPVRLDASDRGANDLFGAAIALRNGQILIGAPRHGGSGAVFLFTRDTVSGEWREETKLSADTAQGIAVRSGLGSAVAFDAEAVLVGVPGARQSGGMVVTFARDSSTGRWSIRDRLAPADVIPGDRFGTTLTIAGDELWVSAPAADENRGRLYRFVRDAATGRWRTAEALSTRGVEPGYGLGLSLALTTDVAVVGAPFADGGMGRAAVYTRLADGNWSVPFWLSPGGDLERLSGREVRCTDGEAAGFPCQNVDLLAFLPIRALGGEIGESVSDSWGWTDPDTGREYALVGRSGGVAIVDITDPTGPTYLGVLPGNRSGARDIKVFKDHLFFTGDGAGNHGLLVFDLSRLRDVSAPPVTFELDARYDGIASAHNLVIDTESGFAFTVGNRDGGNTCGGGLHMIDIRNPLHPEFAGCYTDTEGLIWPGRTHDAQCVVYRGPDDDYRGRQLCFASNETALRIVDVTDKTNPVPIAAATYPGISYVHQGWLTDDHHYFYLDDELDELVGQADRTRTLVWDVADLDDPVLVGEFFGTTRATDHNLYIKNDRMYQANYQAGFRVIDISDPTQPVEIGFFDTTPYEGNPPGFAGAWTAYPFFESGTVIVSSMNEGLFVLRPRMRELVP